MKDSRSCEAIREDIKAFLDGELATGRRMTVLRHVATCPSCREEADAMKQFSETLRYQEGSSEGERLDPALRARILAALPETPPPAPRVSPLAWLFQKPMLTLSTAVAALFALVFFRPVLLQSPTFPLLQSDKSAENYAADAPAAASGSAGRVNGPGEERAKAMTKATGGLSQKGKVEFERSPTQPTLGLKSQSAASTAKPTSPPRVSMPAIVSPSTSPQRTGDGPGKLRAGGPPSMPLNTPGASLDKSHVAFDTMSGAASGKKDNIQLFKDNPPLFAEGPEARSLKTTSSQRPDSYLMLQDGTRVAPNTDLKAKATPVELGVVVSDLEQSRDKLNKIVKEAGGTVALVQPNLTARYTLKDADNGGKTAYFTLKIPAALQGKVIQQVTGMSKESQVESLSSVLDQTKKTVPDFAAAGVGGRGGALQQNRQNGNPITGGNAAQNAPYGLGGLGGGGGGFGGGGGRAADQGPPGPAGPGAPAQKPAGGALSGSGGARRSGGIENRPNKNDRVEQDKLVEKNTALNAPLGRQQAPNLNYNRSEAQTAPQLDRRNFRNQAEAKQLEFQDIQARKRGAQMQTDFFTFVVRLSEIGEKGDSNRLRDQNQAKPAPGSQRNPKR